MPYALTVGLTDLVTEHGDRLREVARRICRTESDADDLVQDVFERALKHLNTQPKPANTQAWLLTILHNRFIDRCRTAKRERSSDAPSHSVEQVPEAPPEAEPAWTRVSDEQLQVAINHLDEGFRRTYVMHDVEGRSYDEIAAALKINKSTVGTRLLRARRKLKALLEGKVQGDA